MMHYRLRGYVRMYVYLQIAQWKFYACVCIFATLVQYNPMLVCVCMSVTFVQLLGNSVAKMCRGRLRPRTTAWPVWPVSYGRTQPQAYQVSAPLTAHRVRFQ